MPVRGDQLRSLYEAEKARILAVPLYAQDYRFVDARRWDIVREEGPQTFLLEHAYVVLCSGFKNSVVEGFWPRYLDAWGRWARWETINTERAVMDCGNIFRNRQKNGAIGLACQRMRLVSWQDVCAAINAQGVDALLVWPWIGPITKHHLARNLGIDTVKPDRHLVRWAERLGYATPLDLCEAIHELTGDRIGSVDLVLWRSAEAFGAP